MTLQLRRIMIIYTLHANLYLIIIIKFCQFLTFFGRKILQYLLNRSQEIKKNMDILSRNRRAREIIWKQSLTFDCLSDGWNKKIPFVKLKRYLPWCLIYLILQWGLDDNVLKFVLGGSTKEYQGCSQEVFFSRRQIPGKLTYSMAKITDGSALGREIS